MKLWQVISSKSVKEVPHYSTFFMHYIRKFTGIRNALLQTEDNECQTCHRLNVSLLSIIVNNFLRAAVNSFKNNSGYYRKDHELQNAMLQQEQHKSHRQPIPDNSSSNSLVPVSPQARYNVPLLTSSFPSLTQKWAAYSFRWLFDICAFLFGQCKVIMCWTMK